MTAYRDIQEIQDDINRLQEEMHLAILSEEIRDMTQHAGAAQAITVAIRRKLDALFEAASPENEQEARFLAAARNSITEAANAAAETGLGTDVPSTRARLLRFKTLADFADAYVRSALGFEQV